MLRVHSNTLHDGDPLEPSSMDIIIQEGSLPVGESVPEGWRVMTGNNSTSLVMRIVYRYEIEDENS